MMKTLVAAAIAAMAFAGTASAETTVVHKHVEKTVQRGEMHMDHHGRMHMDRGHHYGHRHMHRHEMMMHRHMMHHHMAPKHVEKHVSKDVMGADGHMKHVEKQVSKDVNK